MQVLVEDTLSFANAAFLGTGTDAVDLVNLVCCECAERAQAGHAVRLVQQPNTAVVMGNAAALCRAIGNLIDNALRYGGEAEVSVATRNGAAEIVVDDRGPGVKPADRDRIFEPFLRLEGSRNRDWGGVGLGLAVVKQVAERHRGAITVTDRPGGGARFEMSFPLARSP